MSNEPMNEIPFFILYAPVCVGKFITRTEWRPSIIVMGMGVRLISVDGGTCIGGPLFTYLVA